MRTSSSRAVLIAMVAVLVPAVVVPGGASGSPRTQAVAKAVTAVGNPPEVLSRGVRFTVPVRARKVPAFWFSKYESRHKGDVRAHAKVKIKHGRGKAKLTTPKLSGGSWWLLACASATSHVCVHAKRDSGVFDGRSMPPAVGSGPSSYDLIQKALVAHKLSATQALVDDVYAAYDSAKLPAKFRGHLSQITMSDDLLGQVEAKWPHLSAATHKELAPFFVPPIYAHSAIAPAAASKRGASVPAVLPGWRSVDSKHVRVWYPPGDEGVPDSSYREYAQLLSKEMETRIWPKLTAFMKRTPISDAHVAHNGGDGRYDIYIRPLPRRASGRVFMPSGTVAQTVSYDAYCDAGPRWTWVYTEMDFAMVAHEFMHALVGAYAHKDCPKTAFWDEDSANYAVLIAYPPTFFYGNPVLTDFTEAYLYDGDPSRGQFNVGYRVPLEKFLYNGWLFAYYLEDKVPGGLRNSWVLSGKEEMLPAIDDAAKPAGGLRKLWPEFAFDNLNTTGDLTKSSDGYWDQHHITGSYTLFAMENPGPKGVSTVGPSDNAVKLKMRNGPQTLPHLATREWWFKFTKGVRTVSFRNIAPFEGENPDAHLQAYVLAGGKKYKLEDWTGSTSKNYCRALAHQNVTGLILIFSNSSTSKDIPWTSPPEVTATNIACDSWIGTVHGKMVTTSGAEIDSTAKLTFTRKPDSPDDPLYYTPSGSVTWTGTYDEGDGCTGSDSGTTKVGPDDGYMFMSWDVPNDHPDIIATRDYGGQVGGVYQWSYTCPGDPGPKPLLAFFPAWDTGGEGRKVSLDGLSEEGSSSIPNADGTGTSTYTWDLENIPLE